jgi:hypothetical protein
MGLLVGSILIINIDSLKRGMNKQYEGQCMIGIHPDFVILYVFFFKPDLNLQAVLWLRRLLVGFPPQRTGFNPRPVHLGVMI